MQSLPTPTWFPDANTIKAANITKAMQKLGFTDYKAFHQWSYQHYQDFWRFVCTELNIQFINPYTEIVDLTAGVEQPRWFPAATMNITQSCFNTAANKIAIIYQAETGDLMQWTYSELEKLTNRVANSLLKQGFTAGDAIAIMLPMTPECVAIYLGIIKAGCVAVSIADSFASDEIATRLRITHAKAIFTQDYLIRNHKQLPLYEKVLAANAPMAIVLSCHPEEYSFTCHPEEYSFTCHPEECNDEGSPAIGTNSGRSFVANAPQDDRQKNAPQDGRRNDLSWQHFLDNNEQFNAVTCKPQAAITILFSSGTTGDPKAIPWDHTTAIKCASDAYFHQDVKPDDILAWPTNLGWMMGPWLIFAALINHGTLALYGGAPTGRDFGEFIQNAKVTLLGLVPSLVKAWRNSRCMEGLNWQSIKLFSSSGESSNVDDMLYLMALAGNKPIIEYCGGTEIGGAYMSGTVIQPAAPAAFTTPTLGLNFILLNEQRQPADTGEVALIPPSIGLSTRLLNKDHYEVYFADMPRTPAGEILRRHGDEIQHFANGFYRALGRVDDTMNLGGIKISSVEIERTLLQSDKINEVAAIAIEPTGGGPSLLIIYAVLKQETPIDLLPLKKELQMLINQHLNPLFKIHEVVAIQTLPRTASNKIMRRILKINH